MDDDTAEVENVPKSPCAPKVLDALCCELMKVSDKITSILPAIESAQPGSSSGIQVLCSLNNTIEEIKLLVCYCSESSKLYLATTAEPIKLRCQRILTCFTQSLHEIRSMVPLLLASKISEVLHHLKGVRFIVDSREDEARKALLHLLAQNDSREDQELEVLQFVSSRLNITSAKALLVERRSIKKLLYKFQGAGDKKERILKYFLYLLKKYGSLIELKPNSTKFKQRAYTQEKAQSQEESLDLWQSSLSNSASSLENVSTVLLDGTKGDFLHESEVMKMSSLSFGANCSSDSSPISDQLFSWSDDYRSSRSFSNFSRDMYLRFFFELSELPTLLQEKVVEHLKNILEGDEVTSCAVLSNEFTEALILFLKKSHMLFDIPAQQCGAHIFLALMNNKRWELSSLNEKLFQLLSSFLNLGISTEALMILQKLAHRPDCISHIVESSIPHDLTHYLYSGDCKYVEIVMKILSELSFHGEMRSLFISSNFVEKLGELLSDGRLVKHCLNILLNLFNDEEALRMIVDADGCITSIASVLESGCHEEQEQAVTILLILCSHSSKDCLLVLKEGVIPSLIDISANGNDKGKENTMKLLHILTDIQHSDCCIDSPPPETDLVEHPLENSKKLQPKYKRFGFFSRKM